MRRTFIRYIEPAELALVQPDRHTEAGYETAGGYSADFRRSAFTSLTCRLGRFRHLQRKCSSREGRAGFDEEQYLTWAAKGKKDGLTFVVAAGSVGMRYPS